jgi:hypothetical protein
MDILVISQSACRHGVDGNGGNGVDLLTSDLLLWSPLSLYFLHDDDRSYPLL